jgi:thiol-disulfide isomerase/thioredoxin
MVAQVKINHGDWNLRMKVARDFIEGRRLLEMGRPVEAEAILQHTYLGNSKKDGITIDADETFALFKAEIAAAANKTRSAYDSVSAYYSNLPSDRMRKALLTYASRLGIDSNKADSDIWQIRNANAWQKTKFTLRSFIDSSKVSIADFQGKIVLITYWNPGCVPCRKEFPHIQAVLDKMNSADVVHLGIDVFNEQEQNVMPFVRANHLTFIPLHDDPNADKGNLPRVAGIPENFILDQDGRVVFSDFIITGSNERTLELMLTELLKFGKSTLTTPPAVMAKK